MITHGSAKQPSDPTASDWGAPVIAEILSATKPRYHFSSEKPIYWEREPFEFTNNTYTRFISLGEFANKSKERWFYAFNLAPIATGSIQPRPVNVTPCPLSSNAIGKFAPASRGMKRAFGQVENEEPSNYIFGGGTGKNKPPPKTYVCKICVSALTNLAHDTRVDYQLDSLSQAIGYKNVLKRVSRGERSLRGKT